MEPCYIARSFFLLWFCLTPIICYAAAWLPPKGSGQIITTLSHYRISDALVGVDPPTTATFQKTELSSYAEIGVTDSMALGVVPRFQVLSSSDNTISGEIFVRKCLWQGEKSVISIQPLLQLPGAYSMADSAIIDNQHYTQAEMRLLFGYSNVLYHTPFFIDSSIAYRSGFDNDAEEWRLDNSLGIYLFPKWMLLLQLFEKYRPAKVVESVNYTTKDAWGYPHTVEYPLYHTYFDTLAQISVVHPVTNTISLQLGTFSHMRNGEEWVGNGFLVSVWVNF